MNIRQFESQYAALKVLSVNRKMKNDDMFLTFKKRQNIVTENSPASWAEIVHFLKQDLLNAFVGDFLEDAVVAKEGGTMTLQSITSDGISHTYREDIRMKSLQTSLAYSNIVFDLKQILWPQQKEDRWEVLYEKFASNTNTCLLYTSPNPRDS